MPKNRLKKKRLDAIMAGSMFGRCRWCGDIIANQKRVAERFEIISVAGKRISFIDAFGVVVTHKVATLDHVVPRRDGGTWDIENLVPACDPCNTERTRQYPQPTQEHCKRCGRIKFKTSGNFCFSCQADGLERALKDMRAKAEQEKSWQESLGKSNSASCQARNGSPAQT